MEEEEEEEEENSDVHFKRKREGEHRRKRVVKKPRRHTPVVTESESVEIISPSAPLVIKLSMQKKAAEKAAPGLGKVSSHLQDFLIILSSRAANLLIWEIGTEIAGGTRRLL